MKIGKVAVLGSGVMGAGIAAHAANAGMEVVLLDIVPKDAASRNQLAESAIERQLKSGGFTHAGNAKRVTPGNLEDHLPLLAECDWIIEAVLERLDVKHDVYRKINAVRKKGSIVSSNTSTIPLHDLVAGIGGGFESDFMIAHFFNPPRHMRLLEVVKGKDTRQEAYDAVCAFADEKLGKLVVECKDTPGFIGNRIGVFWMYVAFEEAVRANITVEQADVLMGRPVGIPKTGVFGLFDLIGLDLMPLIAKSMLDTLPEHDPFRRLENNPPLLQKLIAEGYTGRKGKGGFYRLVKDGEAKRKEALDLKTGEYRAEAPAQAPKGDIRALAEQHEYVWNVLSRTIAYAASLLPQIADDVVAVDEALESGYSWKWGPFKWLDALGADYVAERLRKEGRDVPPYIAQAAGKRIYREQGKQREFLQLNGNYAQLPHRSGHFWLKDAQSGTKPVLENASAKLWDIGNGAACLELTSKMGAVDMDILSLIGELIPVVQQNFKALVIAGDHDYFSAGANLNVFLAHAQNAEWQQISYMIRRGQQAMMALKYAPFPVVAALSGLALGGGCEIILHAHEAQAHIESAPGLVEVGVGLIPAWGGCKEMRLRFADNPAAAFGLILSAKRAASAQEALDMRVLQDPRAITMNRARLLADAKKRALALSKPNMHASALEAANADELQSRIDTLMQHAGAHQRMIAEVLKQVFLVSGSEQAVLDAEHDGFMELIKSTPSQERIAHMLKTGKALAN